MLINCRKFFLFSEIAFFDKKQKKWAGRKRERKRMRAERWHKNEQNHNFEKLIIEKNVNESTSRAIVRENTDILRVDRAFMSL